MKAAGCESQGPRLVFFTGGTALRDLSRCLARYTRNSVHLVTPFDSGGSSAALRKAFAMPAVGDMRNRLLALADSASVPQAVLDFCADRLPPVGDAAALRTCLRRMGQAHHEVWQKMPESHAEPLRRQLCCFLERMPADFEPHLASLGNLVLAGGYLQHKRDFGPILSLLGQLLRVRGVVCPIVDESLHLAAELSDGSLLVGQHTFKNLRQPVRRLFLTVHEPGRLPAVQGGTSGPQTPCRPPLSADAAAWLRAPAAICYPMGSFYTSVLANLLPQGVGRAIAAARCPKIFIPNSGQDPELCGLSLSGQVAMLLRHLREDAPHAPTEDLLRWVMVDSQNGRYQGGLGADVRQELENLGVRLLLRGMVSPDDPQRHEPELTVRALLALVAESGGVEHS
ncbi:MAG: GAK system CofD-like protein [Desulfovibrionaceae bacterium]|nr:GAK system CofD-like protein [Desulfovibrionaceae bacterium]